MTFDAQLPIRERELGLLKMIAHKNAVTRCDQPIYAGQRAGNVPLRSQRTDLRAETDTGRQRCKQASTRKTGSRHAVPPSVQHCVPEVKRNRVSALTRRCV